jgi:hypothetical protein
LPPSALTPLLPSSLTVGRSASSSSSTAKKPAAAAKPAAKSGSSGNLNSFFGKK